MSRAIVIGAGLAGMSAAIRLRCLGLQVDVYEANAGPGGKLSQFENAGFRFDMGPSLFTMPQLIEELFAYCDEPMAPFLQYSRKEVICKYYYEDGTRFTAFADQAQFAQEAARTFDVSSEDVKRYLSKSQAKYEATASLFLEKSLHLASTYLSTDTIKALLKAAQLDLMKSLHKLNSKAFEDERLVQFFDRFATYNGSDPYRTPGIMSMIPHLEQGFGTYFPKGGMYSISQALHGLALKKGVNFHFEQKVEKIKVDDGKARGVLIDGELEESEIVVSNMDVVPSYRRLMPEQKAPEATLSQERSSSALIFYWGINRSFEELDLHNIFFAKNYRDEFKALFDRDTISADPTVYVNISSKEELSDAPPGQENWFVMVNAPGDKGQDWDQLIQEARGNVIKKLSKLLGVDIDQHISTERILDPRGIERNTSSYQGSLYGAASNDRFAAFLRHPNFSKRIKGLYFCGGSVHPGGGIPLCILSGKIVSELIEQDYRRCLASIQDTR